MYPQNEKTLYMMQCIVCMCVGGVCVCVCGGGGGGGGGIDILWPSQPVMIMYILFVLRFYGPVNPMGSCQAQSVYLTTSLLGRLSPLSG